METETQKKQLSQETRESLDVLRAWCVSCIARAPAVECADTRTMVHGMCQTMQDEIAFIDDILADNELGNTVSAEEKCTRVKSRKKTERLS